MLPEADHVRLRHMLDAARSVMRFAQGRRREDLDTDEMLAFAIIRGLEIIGEAAAQVSEAGRQARPELPWALIAGMRHASSMPTSTWSRPRLGHRQQLHSSAHGRLGGRSSAHSRAWRWRR